MNDHQNEQPRPENPPEQSKQPEDSSQSTLYQLVTGDAPPPVRIRFESTPPLSAPPRLTRTGALQPNPRVREDAISADLKDYLEELELWAIANRKDALRDTIAFWSLKVPAIFVSASAGIWAYFQLPTISIICGSIASFCIIIDGIHPRGMLRNMHLRAYHDIRNLEHQIMNKYRNRSSTASADNTSRRLIKESEAERQRIASYIREAETALTEQNTK